MVCLCLGDCICAAAATASTMISYYFYDKMNKEQEQQQQQHCRGCNTVILDEKISDNKFNSITRAIATVISCDDLSDEDQEIIDIFYNPEKEMKI